MGKKIYLEGLEIDNSISGKVYKDFEDFYKDYKRSIKLLNSHLNTSRTIYYLCFILAIFTILLLLGILFMLSKLENYSDSDALFYVFGMLGSIFLTILTFALFNGQKKRNKEIEYARRYYLLTFFKNTNLNLENPICLDDIRKQSEKYRNSKVSFIDYFENSIAISFSVIAGCYVGFKAEEKTYDLLLLFIIIVCIYALISALIKQIKFLCSADYIICTTLEEDIIAIKWLIETEKIDTDKLCEYYKKEIQQLDS